MKYVSALLFVGMMTTRVWGQVSLTTIGATYTQNFDGLAQSRTDNTWTDNGTIIGWYSNRTVYIADSGSSTTGGLHSYGSTNATDRALGALSSGSTSPVFAVRLVNNTGTTIDKLLISYTGEQWRLASGAQILTFDYQVGATSDSTGTWTPFSGLDFTALKTGSGASDGNAIGNYSIIKDSITVSAISGQEIWLRWSKTGSSSPGLAIDDFSVTPMAEDHPLPVTMKDISARVDAGKVCLNISTATEIDVAGFNVLRSSSKDGPFELISSYTSNVALRTSGNSTSGASYSFVDAKVVGGRTYYYKIESVTTSGVSEQVGEILEVKVTVPKEFSLYQNYPNPFNPATRIRFDLKEDANVILEIYNVLGMKVKSFSNEVMPAGTHEIQVDMTAMSSGVYYYKLTAVDDAKEKFVQALRMTFMK